MWKIGFPKKLMVFFIHCYHVSFKTTLLRVYWGGWNDHCIGEQHKKCFPMSTKKIVRQYKTTSNNKRIKKEVPKYPGVFQNLLFTINFSSPFHIDQCDGDTVTHCSYSIPKCWKLSNKTQGVFGIGDKMIDLSCHNCTISFMPRHSYHCTGIPISVPAKIPEILEGNKNFESVIEDRNVIKSYLSKSVIAWGGWGHRDYSKNK